MSVHRLPPPHPTHAARPPRPRCHAHSQSQPPRRTLGVSSLQPRNASSPSPCDPCESAPQSTAGRSLHSLLQQKPSSLSPLSLDLLCWYYQRSTFLLDREHKEFGCLCITCVPANGVNIVGTFIKALAWPQRDLFSAFHLHHDGAFQHVNRHLR